MRNLHGADGALESAMDRAAAALERELWSARSAAPDHETGLGAAAALTQLVSLLSQRGGFDSPSAERRALRVNSAQVNAAGTRVPGALNKPDISFVFGAANAPQRSNIEIDTNAKQSHAHQRVVDAKDPNARNLYLLVDNWTGAPKSGRFRDGVTGRERPLTQAELRGLAQAMTNRGGALPRGLASLLPRPLPAPPLARRAARTPKPTAARAPRRRRS